MPVLYTYQGITFMIIVCLLEIFAAVFFGFEFVDIFIPGKFNILTIFAIGGPFGIILSSWLFYISSIYLPLTKIHGIYHSTVLILSAIIIHLVKKTKKHKKIISIYSTIFSVVIPFLVVSYIFEKGLLYQGYFSKGAAYGDLPFHLNIISSFAYGCNSQRKSLWDIVSPFFSNVRMAYPFVPNFYSAVLISTSDVTYHESIVYPSYVMLFGVFQILEQLIYTFTGYKFAPIIGVYIFLFLGGNGFYKLFTKNFDRFYVDFVHNLGGGEQGYWFHPIVHVLLPQRNSLFSLPISWSIILLLIKSPKKFDPKHFTMIALLISSLPQVMAHSVIALFEWGIVYAILHITKKNFKNTILNYLVMCSIGISLGLFQMYPYLGRAKNKFMSVKPIWIESKVSCIQFWWRGLYGFIVIALVNGVIILNKRQLKLYLPSLAVFLISNIILYQPWNMDNTKVFYVGWIPLAIAVVSNFYVRIFEKFGYTSLIFLIPLFVLCSASGFFAMKFLFDQSFPLWSYEDKPYEFGKWVTEHSHPKSVWVSSVWHAHPIATIAGRQRVLGYLGWIGTHGLDPSQRMLDSRQFEAAPWDPAPLDKYGVEFICVKNNDPKGFNLRPVGNSFAISYKDNVYTVYRRVNKTS